MNQAVLFQLVRICALALASLAFGFAMLSTEHWAIMLNSFLFGVNLAGVVYISDVIRMRRRIRTLTDVCNKMNDASMGLVHALMNQGWEKTGGEHLSIHSDYDKPSVH